MMHDGVVRSTRMFLFSAMMLQLLNEWLDVESSNTDAKLNGKLQIFKSKFAIYWFQDKQLELF